MLPRGEGVENAPPLVSEEWREGVSDEVRSPTEKNVPTAYTDRTERRPRPQTPCPEVQPLPRVVPTPARAPPTRDMAGEGALLE